jgi:Type I phosphodiesterase / nucleotide pyrophosphatase
MAAKPKMVWNRLAGDGMLAALTSISPSTTSAALTSYWTSTPARAHGITGYEMWLKEYGMVVNSILHTPMSFHGGRAGSLAQAGFSPEAFLPVPPIGPHLAAHGVEAHVFQHYSIIDSGLSRMYFDQTHKNGCGGAVDMWYRVHQLWENHSAGKLFAWAYWPDVDGLSHLHGPDDSRISEEFSAFSEAFERLFLDRLSAKARQGTAVILTADHGQITTDKLDGHYDLRNHPDMTRRLHIFPTGENRLAFLHIRPGQIEAVREYVERTWPNQFTLLDSAYTVEKGLFGPGERHPGLLDRVGDLVAVASGRAFWWWGDKPNPIIGRHGGLSAEEMIVPFLAARL